MRKVYFFSGLGADKRVFQLLKCKNYVPVHIAWIRPLPFESMAAYALRVTEQIDEPRPILVGLSFGGLMAIEVGKLMETEKIIILASAKTRREIPIYYRLAGRLGLHKLLPDFVIRRSSFLANWFFGAECELDKQVLASILVESDPIFVRWAIHQLVKWQNTDTPSNLVHIHGTSDRALPRCFTNSTIAVPRGGHFMTLNRADDLSQLIEHEV